MEITNGKAVEVYQISSLEVVNISDTYMEESLECVIASFPRTVCKCIRLRLEAN